MERIRTQRLKLGMISLYQAQYREVDTTRKAPRLRERLIRAKNCAEYYTKTGVRLRINMGGMIVIAH